MRGDIQYVSFELVKGVEKQCTVSQEPEERLAGVRLALTLTSKRRASHRLAMCHHATHVHSEAKAKPTNALPICMTFSIIHQ